MIRHTAYAFLFLVVFLFAIAGMEDELEAAQSPYWSGQ
jgi:hypothetical protein